MHQLKLEKIEYRSLNPRQQEYFNFHQVAGLLAHYGFACHWINDDWNGADFIAIHLSGYTLKVQQKSRITFKKAYYGKSLYVAFPYKDIWYLYPHDVLLDRLLALQKFVGTSSWDKQGIYHIGSISKEISVEIAPYMLGKITYQQA